ncbi:MAG: hypothetical protein HY070_05080, partial [Chloroflexi bacterium]|nr:hypothetical protein [Chloroflexota bacterium]
MFDQLIGVIVIWAMTIVSNMERLFSNDTINIPSRKIAKRTIGILIVILSTLGLLVQAYISLNKANQARLLQQVVIDTNSILFNEASGGAAIDDVAYIVDDEKPRVFKLRLSENIYHFVE